MVTEFSLYFERDSTKRCPLLFELANSSKFVYILFTLLTAA